MCVLVLVCVCVFCCVGMHVGCDSVFEPISGCVVEKSGCGNVGADITAELFLNSIYGSM